ncbi:uncharacterized protein LOC142240815 isoform X2 [Haematobia irritans]|uniref:uncharacterized protein LOC142240815 isoform X2 n=1 Tax=Haematobia irritans TaxID=7368 RepID=UPI003F4FDB9F
MKILQKISALFATLCVLQWQSMQVSSASTASSSQLSYAKSSGGDQSKDGSSSGLLGAIYRKSRQSRCVTCYDDRYDDRSRYYGGGAGAAGGYSRSGSSADERGWYYPRNDRYDDRYRGAEGDYDRYGYESRGYRGRYGSESRGYGYDNRDIEYDRRGEYDRRYSEKRGYERGEMRGYGYGGGYESRDRYYGGYERGGDYSRDRGYERPRYGSSGAGGYGYDRDYYDRYSPRMQTGYEKSTSGGYYYGKGVKEDRRYLPEPSGYRSPSSSPCGVQKPNCPYAPQDGGTRVSSGPIDSGNHHIGVPHSIYNPGANQNDSSKGSSSGWSYMREEDADRHPPRGTNDNSGNGGGVGGGSSSSASNRDRNRDQQSPAYGALLDRGSNLIAVEPAKTSEDGQENNDKTQSSSSSSSSSSAAVDNNEQTS